MTEEKEPRPPQFRKGFRRHVPWPPPPGPWPPPPAIGQIVRRHPVRPRRFCCGIWTKRACAFFAFLNGVPALHYLVLSDFRTALDLGLSAAVFAALYLNLRPEDR